MRALDYLALEKVCKSENVSYKTKHVMALIFDKFSGHKELSAILAHFAAEGIAFDYDLNLADVTFDQIRTVILDGYKASLSAKTTKNEALIGCNAKFKDAKQELLNSVKQNPADKISENQFSVGRPEIPFSEVDLKNAAMVEWVLPKKPGMGRK